jgi:hypothetical protein
MIIFGVSNIWGQSKNSSFTLEKSFYSDPKYSKWLNLDRIFHDPSQLQLTGLIASD